MYVVIFHVAFEPDNTQILPICTQNLGILFPLQLVEENPHVGIYAS